MLEFYAELLKQIFADDPISEKIVAYCDESLFERENRRLNLSSSIRNIFEKGVDNAIAEHQNQDAITEHKKAIGYIEAVDMEMEELSEVQKTVIKGE